MKDCTYALHLAAWSSLDGFQDRLHSNYSTNVTGFLHVIEAARLAGVKKFVYASSSAAYGDGRNCSFREREAIDQSRLTSHYGKSKLMNEMIADSYAQTGMKVLGLRYFNVYGPGDEKKNGRCAPMQHFFNSREQGQPIMIYGDGHQAKDFIWIDDAVEATFKLMESDVTGICNVGTGIATNFNTLAEMVAPGHPIMRKPYPASGYQYFTRADTTKLRTVIGQEYEFLPVSLGVKKLVPAC
jgi:UDP-glucose 4-epimerase